MQFVIQICNPITQPPDEESVEDLSQAIEDIFPLMTEDAIIRWNWIPVRVSYKYDLPIIIPDILDMLDDLLSSDKGSHRVLFGSNSFNAIWNMEWADGCLKITSHWESTSGNYEDLLNQRNTLEIEVDKFINEWKALLKKTIKAIDQSGIEIEEQQELADLRRVENSIAEFGSLYVA